MYYEYWGMNKHPFNNVPDPEMYFEMHHSVESAIAEVLFAIEEGDECLAVLVGDVGVGKTMALRIILSVLDPEAYQIAFITNPDLTFPQLLREIIGQLRNKPCQIMRRESLLEEFNKFIFETADMGKRTLIFIDEANALRPAELQSLRLLTNMQEDTRNLFSLILAGQTELAKRLEHTKARNLFQRVGVYCRIEKMESIELMRYYVEHRLELAGCSRPVFTDESFEALWEFSEEGIPRMVNKICKLALKAGETNCLEQIGAEVIRGVGSRFLKQAGLDGKQIPHRVVPDEEGIPSVEELAGPSEQKAVIPDDTEAEESIELPEVVEEEVSVLQVQQAEARDECLPEEAVALTKQASVVEESPSVEDRPLLEDNSLELEKALSEMAFSQTNPFRSIRPVNQDGSIVYRRRRYLVDSELAGEEVMVSEVNDRLFVQFGDQLSSETQKPSSLNRTTFNKNLFMFIFLSVPTA